MSIKVLLEESQQKEKGLRNTDLVSTPLSRWGKCRPKTGRGLLVVSDVLLGIDISRTMAGS